MPRVLIETTFRIPDQAFQFEGGDGEVTVYLENDGQNIELASGTADGYAIVAASLLPQDATGKARGAAALREFAQWLLTLADDVEQARTSLLAMRAGPVDGVSEGATE